MLIKKILCLILSLFALTVCAACSSQDSKKVSLIKMMYVKNDSIWKNEMDPYKLTKDLGKLYEQYCSVKFKKELLEEQKSMGLDHDLITADWPMDNKSLGTMKIYKKAELVFHVSYVTHIEDPTGKMKVYQVVLCVRLTKERGCYKIENVTDLTTP